MHRREVLGLLGGSTALGLAGCIADTDRAATAEREAANGATTDAGAKRTPSDGDVVAEVDPNELVRHELFEKYHDSSATHVSDGEYTIAVRTLRYAYDPGSVTTGFEPIRVPDDSTVSFYVGSVDATHAFTVTAKGLHVRVPPGKIVEAVASFDRRDEPTEYDITCGGCEQPTQRDDMRGTIRVLPSDRAFDGA